MKAQKSQHPLLIVCVGCLASSGAYMTTDNGWVAAVNERYPTGRGDTRPDKHHKLRGVAMHLE